MACSLAFDRIAKGHSLGGAQIPFQEVICRLATLSGHGLSWVVQRAVIPDFALPEDFDGRIRFVDCLFLGSSSFGFCDMLGHVEFTDCEFFGPLTLSCCGVDDDDRPGLLIDMQGTVFHAALTIESNILERPPTFSDVRFHGEVSLERNQLVSGSPALEGQFQSCLFGHRLRYEDVAMNSLLQFGDCQFEQGSFIQLHLVPVDGHGQLAFTQCSIAGRVVVNPGVWAADNVPADRRIHVALKSSIISGEADISGVKLASLDLFETSIAGGRFVVRRDQLSHAERNPWMFWLRAADNDSVLVSERRFAENRTSDSARRVAREFEELKNAFAAMPVTDTEEDYCHYKTMDYNRICQTMSIPDQHQDTGSSPSRACPICVTLIAAASMAAMMSSAASLPLVMMVVLFAVIARWHWTSVRVAFNWTILKWMLGYGVYPHRLLGWGTIIIALYAGFYFVSIQVDPIRFRITDGECSILEDQPGKASPPAVGFYRTVYFSGVTFSTLGYGDYHPEGVLRIVAVSEALLGALVMALVVALFGRKFMRR